MISATRIFFERLRAPDVLLDPITEYIFSHVTAPADIDPRVEAIIRNDSGGEHGRHDHVLRANTDTFRSFCDEIENDPPAHSWMNSLPD